MAQPPKPAPPPLSPDRRSGTVVRRVVDRSFGFIRDLEGGEEYFFHATDLENCEFAGLSDGSDVTFAPTTTPKGARAAAVRRI